MFYASYAKEDGTLEGHLFDNYLEFLELVGTASPISLIDFKVKGRTYAEKKNSLRQVAIEYTNAECGGMFMSEYAKVGRWFALMGKRYGLDDEFINEGVI